MKRLLLVVLSIALLSCNTDTITPGKDHGERSDLAFESDTVKVYHFMYISSICFVAESKTVPSSVSITCR